MKNKYDLSVVIPAFQAGETISPLLQRLKNSLAPLKLVYEIILVDDGSTDETWNLIESACKSSVNLTGIKFSRNFGQHYAISAGLSKAQGERIVVMDGDLQDQPEEIPKLYMKAREGFEIVVGQRIDRKDQKFKIWSSELFYRFFKIITGLTFEPGIANFGVYHSNVIHAVLAFKENFRPFPIIVRTVGFSRTAIEVKHSPRLSGKSNYNGFSLLKGAVNTMIYYSHKPIWIFVVGILSIVAFLFFLVAGVFFLTFKISVLDLVMILVILMSFVSLNVAMIGVYVSRIFIEIKSRPSYIIEKVINNNFDHAD